MSGRNIPTPATAAVIYLLIFPPGNPPDATAPRETWNGNGVTYQSADACARALAKSDTDAIVQKRAPQEVERAKRGLCVLSK